MTENCSTSTGVDEHGVMRRAQTPTLLAYHERPTRPRVPASEIHHHGFPPEHDCEPMAGVGSQQVHSEVTGRATLNDRLVGVSLATDPAEPYIKSAQPFQRHNIARRIAGLLSVKLFSMARIAARRSRTKRRRQRYPSRRETFIEDAAMDREMFRL